MVIPKSVRQVKLGRAVIDGVVSDRHHIDERNDDEEYDRDPNHNVPEGGRSDGTRNII